MRNATASGTVGALLLTACSAPTTWHAERLPAADALFHQDPRWRGGDAAYSVDLGDERTLWLFGDSFVAKAGATFRRGCAFVRNSAALQTGADPRHARMQFAQGGSEAAPTSWIPEDGDRWFWPLAGLRTGDTVTLFCTIVESTGEPGVFGFRAAGTAAFAFTDVDRPLAQWQRTRLSLPPLPFRSVIGTAVVADDDHVFAFALREPGDHAVFVLRWPRARFAAGELAAPEWFDADRWRPQASLRAAPQPVLQDGAPEFSVQRHRNGWLMVQSLGFGSTTLAVRTAPAPQGPWSAAKELWRPPESEQPGLLVYAGKAHPQLQGAGGGLLATYAANATDLERLLDDDSIYWPRFVRLTVP